jgi:Nif-specific regulatory protein
LENCIEHAVLLSNDGVIHSHNLPPTLEMPGRSRADRTGPMQARVEALERDLLTDSLKRNKGNSNAAARDLGITPRMVRYKIKTLDIDCQRLFGAAASQPKGKAAVLPHVVTLPGTRVRRTT